VAQVRRLAATALGASGSAERNWFVGEQPVLAEVGTKDALPFLESAAEDKEFEVRLEIEAAIQRIKGKAQLRHRHGLSTRADCDGRNQLPGHLPRQVKKLKNACAVHIFLL
jgi:hypothetical protein